MFWNKLKIEHYIKATLDSVATAGQESFIWKKKKKRILYLQFQNLRSSENQEIL